MSMNRDITKDQIFAACDKQTLEEIHTQQQNAVPADGAGPINLLIGKVCCTWVWLPAIHM